MLRTPRSGQQHSGETWDEVVQASALGHRRMIEGLQALSVDDVHDAQRFESQQGQPLWRGVAGNGCTHPIMHLAEAYVHRGQAAYAASMMESLSEGLALLDDSPELAGGGALQPGLLLRPGRRDGPGNRGVARRPAPTPGPERMVEGGYGPGLASRKSGVRGAVHRLTGWRAGVSHGIRRGRYRNAGRSGPVAGRCVHPRALTMKSAPDRALPVLLLGLLDPGPRRLRWRCAGVCGRVHRQQDGRHQRRCLLRRRLLAARGRPQRQRLRRLADDHDPGRGLPADDRRGGRGCCIATGDDGGGGLQGGLGDRAPGTDRLRPFSNHHVASRLLTRWPARGSRRKVEPPRVLSPRWPARPAARPWGRRLTGGNGPRPAGVGYVNQMDLQ